VKNELELAEKELLQNLKNTSQLSKKHFAVFLKVPPQPLSQREKDTQIWNYRSKVVVTVGTKKLPEIFHLHSYTWNVAYAKFLINLEGQIWKSYITNTVTVRFKI